MTVDRRIEEPEDQFPIGMRVLAVDDDPTCLKLLETLLRRCQYHVTATNQARTALDMLRENTDNFDLVISDVHMPDMDGFKLLELVGLEMDLPVIMLSANGDPKLVMKGISHGACDYLLKPVRIEELKNVWQHVIRRKKVVPRRNGRPSGAEGDNQGSAGAESLDQNARGTKKRKDQNDDEDNDENDEDTDENGAQKKPRVVWSVDLHRKFVLAVNQLGIDKAVPKKILDLMNVEKLTRENVASHLQKYRLYLKRISCVQNQHASMAAAFGGTDPSYLRVGPMNAHGNFNSPLAISVPFQSHHLNNSHHNQPSYRSFHPGNGGGGVIGRLNSPSSLGLRLPSSSGMIHVGPGSNPHEPIKFHDPALLIDNGLGIGNGALSSPDYVSQTMKSEFVPNAATIDGWSNTASSSSVGFQSSPAFQLNDQFKHTRSFDGSSSLIPDPSSQCQSPGLGIQGWDHNNNINNNNSPNMAMPVNTDAIGALSGGLVMKNNMFNRDVDFGSMSQPSYGDASSLVGRYDDVEKSTMLVPYGQRQQGGYMMNNFGPLGDVVGSTMKQEHVKGGDFNGFS